MRAAHITGYGDAADIIDIVDIDTPTPAAGEVRVAVEAVALNHLDVFARRGDPGDEGAFPRRTGCDIAGVVDAVGEDVDGDWVGQPVVVYPGVSCLDCEYCLNGEHTMCSEYAIVGEDRPGGLAEYVTVPAWCLEPRPSTLSPTEAAAVPVAFTTAWRMLVTAGDLDPADAVLVLGASGGVGSAALQIAARYGGDLYATTSTPAKRARIEAAVDDVTVIDYTDTRFEAEIAELTDGRGVDVVVDHVGEATWQQSIDSLAMGGRMVICGATSGADPDIDIRSVYQHHRRIVGAPMGNRQDFRDVLARVAAGALSPTIDRVLPLAETAAGSQALEDRSVVGKVVIEPGH